MLKTYEDKWDQQDAERLEAPQWMLDLLKCNPDYVLWGPEEDYMMEDKGWSGPLYFDGWSEMFGLDELNECVNFYFEIMRDSEDCENCAGDGLHPHAQWISKSAYAHSSPFKPKTAREQEVEDALHARLGMARSSSAVGNDRYYPEEDVLNRYGEEFRRFCEEMSEDPYTGWLHQPQPEEDRQALMVKLKENFAFQGRR